MNASPAPQAGHCCLWWKTEEQDSLWVSKRRKGGTRQSVGKQNRKEKPEVGDFLRNNNALCMSDEFKAFNKHNV